MRTDNRRSLRSPTKTARARFEPYGLTVFALNGERIAGITGFPRRPDLFRRLGLPTTL